jgi:CBS domain-containing protein
MSQQSILYGMCCEPRTPKVRELSPELTNAVYAQRGVDTPVNESAKSDLRIFSGVKGETSSVSNPQCSTQNTEINVNYQDQMENQDQQHTISTFPKDTQATNVMFISPMPSKLAGSEQVNQMLADDPKVFSDNKRLEQSLRSTTAKSLASATDVPEVLLSTSISVVLRHLETNGRSCVLVRDFSVPGSNCSSADTIFNRIDVFRFAMNAKSTALPFSSIVEHLKPVHQVDGDSTLLSVVALMMETGSEEIGVFDDEQGVVRGIITCKSLISFIRHHEQEHAHAELLRNDFGNVLYEEEDDEEAQLMNRTEKENRNRENIGANRFSQGQLVAQVARLSAADALLISIEKCVTAVALSGCQVLPAVPDRVSPDRVSPDRTSAGRGAANSSSGLSSSSTYP